jgi:hypothetical protein
VSAFEPELGQAIFSNSPWGEVETPSYVSGGIDYLGFCVSDGYHEKDPTANSGCEPFDNGTFQMRPYCWCDGEGEGHEDGCPPNFVCGDFEARWYKHARRGASQNKHVSMKEWRQIMVRCLTSLEGHTHG